MDFTPINCGAPQAEASFFCAWPRRSSLVTDVATSAIALTPRLVSKSIGSEPSAPLMQRASHPFFAFEDDASVEGRPRRASSPDVFDCRRNFTSLQPRDFSLKPSPVKKPVVQAKEKVVQSPLVPATPFIEEDYDGYDEGDFSWSMEDFLLPVAPPPPKIEIVRTALFGTQIGFNYKGQFYRGRPENYPKSLFKP